MGGILDEGDLVVGEVDDMQFDPQSLRGLAGAVGLEEGGGEHDTLDLGTGGT